MKIKEAPGFEVNHNSIISIDNSALESYRARKEKFRKLFDSQTRIESLEATLTAALERIIVLENHINIKDNREQ